MIVQEARNLAVNILSTVEQQKRSSSPRLDGDCFLCHILQKERSFLLTYPDYVLTSEQADHFMAMLQKRALGLPVAYILNTKEFYGYNFYVDENVLIPKPDTEILVERAIAVIQEKAQFKNELKIADICTGSGCIIISVIKSLNLSIPIQIYASDISVKALEVAKKNVANLLPNTNITFIESDLLEDFPENIEFDVILSNPPYVPSATTKELLKDGRDEPVLALDGGIDGLDLIRKLIPQVYGYLANDGFFLLETGEYNALESMELLKSAGFSSVRNHKDYAGMLRVSEGKKVLF